MRISTVTMFEQSTASMNRQQSDLMKVSQQIASGRRVVNPSDDPQAASRAVGVDQAKAATEQYSDSRISARNSLSQSESILNSISDAVTSAKTLLIQASSDTLSDVDRESIASELKGVYAKPMPLMVTVVTCLGAIKIMLHHSRKLETACSTRGTEMCASSVWMPRG